MSSWAKLLTQLFFMSGALAASLFSDFNMPNGISNPSYSYSAGGKAYCMTGNIKVSASGSNLKILVPAPVDQYQTTQILFDMQQVGGNYIATATGVPTTVAGDFNIYSKLCFPNNSTAVANLKTIQFLTHGSTLDNTYWDTAPGYSYVDAAADAGYATFSYDRLGTGLSDHPDPLQVVQMPLQVEIAHQLIQLLRAATITNQNFKHIIGGGHSAGSILTLGVTAKYPADFDAIILTGFSASFDGLNIVLAGFAVEHARFDPSGRFNSLADGYFSQGAVIQAVQLPFWWYPGFDTKSMYRFHICLPHYPY